MYGVDFGEEIYTKFLSIFFLMNLKISPSFELWQVCIYVYYMFDSRISE